jgi:hypothetical protein
LVVADEAEPGWAAAGPAAVVTDGAVTDGSVANEVSDESPEEPHPAMMSTLVTLNAPSATTERHQGVRSRNEGM